MGVLGARPSRGSRAHRQPQFSIHTRSFEVKLVDGTASPYLALAGLLSAGIVGIRDRLPLEVERCEERAAEMSQKSELRRGLRSAFR